jgi:hypothetical protein
MERRAEWQKYAYTFLITAVIFFTAIFLSNFFNQKKINEIQNIESRISVDLLSSETQFSLLSELPCNEINNTFLSKEMGELGDKLAATEENRGSDDPEVLNLKKYYSLLQIKDFQLSQKVRERCGNKVLSIIYFYSNKGDCPDCEKEGYVLTKLRQDYPELRVYSFDYNLDLSAIKTLISIYNIKYEPPTLFIGKDIYYGFRSVDDIKRAIPDLAKIDSEKAKLEKLQTATTSKK